MISSVNLNTLHALNRQSGDCSRKFKYFTRTNRQSGDYSRKQNSNVKRSNRLAVDSKAILSLNTLARGYVFMPRYLGHNLD